MTEKLLQTNYVNFCSCGGSCIILSLGLIEFDPVLLTVTSLDFVCQLKSHLNGMPNTV